MVRSRRVTGSQVRELRTLSIVNWSVGYKVRGPNTQKEYILECHRSVTGVLRP